MIRGSLRYLHASSSALNKSKKYDVVIVGGGIAGSALANALDTSLRVCMIESRQPPKKDLKGPFSNRVSSLTPANIQLFKDIGVWDRLDVSRIMPFTNMHVWDEEAGGKVSFNAQEAGQSCIGTIVENDHLTSALFEILESRSTVDVICENPITKLSLPSLEVSSLDETRPQIQDYARLCELTLNNGDVIKSSLVVGADGANSFVRQQACLPSEGWSYNQNGLVATLRIRDHFNRTAWQRFLPTGPIALLPLSREWSSMVWSLEPRMAQKMARVDPEVFCAIVNSAVRLKYAEVEYFLSQLDEDGHVKIGSSVEDLLEEIRWRMEVAGYTDLVNQAPRMDNENGELPVVMSVQEKSRASFPLRFKKTYPYIAPRVALIGDAAHTVHPMAGLGLNLGLGDVRSLSKVINEAHQLGQDVGDLNVLRGYNLPQMVGNGVTMGAIDGLWRMFHANMGAVQWLRSTGMNMLNEVPLLKSQIMRFTSS